ncbi:MAG: cytosine/adenosine deaminase-related metal-dependent hydrolase [Planctomycetota bacterium]|jgi:cytosine/adenosine deaminase-related metal-dependent hydrolase
MSPELAVGMRAKSLVARYVALDADTVLSPGCIQWDVSGRIVSLRRARKSERPADVAVLPGLVNAHAHLQLEPLAKPVRAFLPWVSAVMASRGECSAADHRRIALQSLRELLRSGTTAVGEIDSTGDTIGALRRLPMAGRCYRELTGFHLQQREARALVRDRFPSDAGSMLPGLSPHAPYSVSPDLMRAAAGRTRNLAIHCAELPEEQQFLRTGRGVFADLLRKLGRLPDGFRAPGCGAVRWLQQLGVLRPSTQLVHCQELERGDVARIAAAGASIAVCPGTIDYFGRTPPPVSNWLKLGIPVALGTDSRASNRGLSMRSELARAAAFWPGLTPRELLRMATSNGGRALNGPFGGLRRGRRADFLTVAAVGSWPDTLSAFVHNILPVSRVVLAGTTHRIHAEC